tara:strand:+ start:157 stop:615 length:459 start_codon:yes stop_codon:yes gene_type:complete
MTESSTPLLLNAGKSEDHRGYVEFYNELKLDYYKRFYIVSNPIEGTVRAWHGHKIEEKLIKVLNGEFLICLVKVDNWDQPSKNLEILEYKLNENSGLLYVPSGYANGAINLNSDSKVMYFSSLVLEDSINDDYRFDSKYWNPWEEYSPKIYE